MHDVASQLQELHLEALGSSRFPRADSTKSVEDKWAMDPGLDQYATNSQRMAAEMRMVLEEFGLAASARASSDSSAREGLDDAIRPSTLT